MASRNEEKKLRHTLELAGISESLPKIICQGNSENGIKNVHKETNQLIHKNLKTNSLGECIHVTGEMRAITDPFHRYICEEIRQQNKEVFNVIFNLPKEKQQNTTQIIEWSIEGWISDKLSRKWHEELRTIYSIANRSVSLYAFGISTEIQYSVFGNKYILFNEKHENRIRKKHAWLLESETIHSILTTRAKNIMLQSKSIDEENYRKFTKNINSIVAKHFLSLLKRSQFAQIEKLYTDNFANDFSESPQEILESLRIMGFIDFNASGLASITKSGREFNDVE